MLKELIIKVKNEGIYLNPNLVVPIQQTNIPIQHCKFHTHREIFWKVELIEYNESNNCWKMKVLDYASNDIKDFIHQKSTREVHRISFERFDWQPFEWHLSSYQKNRMLDVLKNHDAERFFREVPKQRSFPALSIATSSKDAEHNAIKFVPTEAKPIIRIMKSEFSVYFSDAHFRLGYVVFSKRMKELGRIVDFKINNDYIIPEFENIKSWFARKLKRKFRVYVTIVLTDGNVTEVATRSPQIEMIDAELIDSIKYHRTLSITKSPIGPITDKSLFTADELFEEMDSKDIEGNVFAQNEQEILNFLIENHKTRNRKQLEYLAGRKQSENSKLRFTLSPNFGFLFLVEGEKNSHFVWELLNSHATYIWTLDKSDNEVELQFKRIEASINLIRDNGREQYKRAYRQNHHDSDLVFSIIEHDDIASNFVDGFVKWKLKLSERLS